MDVLGYLISALIGVSLGLLGAGGSILTVPLLVYIFQVDTAHAIRYSLFIVGVTSSFSAFPKYKKGEVMVFQGSLFATISLLTVILVRKIIVPEIPLMLISFDNFFLTYQECSMTVFAILMFCASRIMMRKEVQKGLAIEKSRHKGVLVLTAMTTGLLTGLLGAGGGFIIVPALSLFFRFDIKKAIGTSLFIIALNSMAGFLIELDHGDLNWLLIGSVTGVALVGNYIGYRLAPHVDSSKLKIYFAWFMLLMAISILSLQILSFQRHHWS